MRKTTIILLFILSGVLGFALSWYIHRPIDKESQQIGEYVVQTFHRPVTFINQLKGDPDAGRKIFKEFCASCHNTKPIIEVHAPRIGDKRMWDALSKQGFPALLKITIDGRGAMPARGGCFECSDEQLSETIQYILKQSET